MKEIPRLGSRTLSSFRFSHRNNLVDSLTTFSRVAKADQSVNEGKPRVMLQGRFLLTSHSLQYIFPLHLDPLIDHSIPQPQPHTNNENPNHERRIDPVALFIPTLCVLRFVNPHAE